MPKRIVDGEALWTSHRLARVEPVRFRAEYANLLPLATANGTFDADPNLVWARVYSFNRPDVLPDDVKSMLDSFEHAGMLIRWRSKKSGKTIGLWDGIARPGRLPSRSRTESGHALFLEEIPEEVLLNQKEKDWSANGQPMADQWSTNGCSGLGLGLGLGKGKGIGKTGPSPQSLFEIWQTLRGQLPGVRELTADRKAKCRARLASPRFSLEDFREAVRRAAETPFLCGVNDRGWRASFDWMIANNSNYMKVLEGRYDDAKPKEESSDSGMITVADLRERGEL